MPQREMEIGIFRHGVYLSKHFYTIIVMFLCLCQVYGEDFSADILARNADSFVNTKHGNSIEIPVNAPLYTNGKIDSLLKKTRNLVERRKPNVTSNTRVDFKRFSSYNGQGNNVRDWQALKRTAKRSANFITVTGKPEFVKLPENAHGESDQISLAVRQTKAAETDSLQMIFLSIAGTAVLVVVVVACLHMPCHCFKTHYKSDLDLDLDLIGCPNPSARHKGRCGKCLFDRMAKKKAKKSFIPRSPSTPVSIGRNNDDLFLASESMYSAQPPWMEDFGMGSMTEIPTKPKKKSRSIIQTILRRSRSRDKFRYEFLAAKYGYNYKQFNHPEHKRSSLYDENEPDWYSAGEFLNRQSRHRAQRMYGSTDPGRTTCTHGCFSKLSRDAPANQSVEDIMKSKPRRRQVVELQEFPIGFSAQNYQSMENFCQHEKGVVVERPKNALKKSQSRPCSHSESNLESVAAHFEQKPPPLKRLSIDDSKSSSRSSFGDTPRASPSPKLIQFYPASFNYETSFVQTSEKYPCEKHKEMIDKHTDPVIVDESSSEDLMSFDEDEEEKGGLFDYSAQIPHYRHNPYQQHLDGFNGYAEMPQYSYYTNPQTRIRRTVRSESELRRARDMQSVPPQRKTKIQSKTRPVSSSDTTLNKTHILKELASVGFAKPSRNKKPAKPVRDARIDPLVGKVSPMIKTKESKPSKQGMHFQERSTVVQMPDNYSCKEVLLDEDLNKSKVTCKLDGLDEQFDKGSAIDYSHAPKDADEKYLKKNVLRDEPVRDTDSDTEGHDITSSVGPSPVQYQSSVVHCKEIGVGSKTREELLTSQPQ
ncbi:uncharacterized protein LOC5517475 [Nematostella vectensis]|uniref:uncharacterized protein LOC5517475 n=1 Tax=Nematostella vectensis TaxID=45351 RepID=UPI00138FD464|nr:uncharacterized protein LOC5517475 [Nematostella vectensis]